jgi:broad specificity phosphatase PhoE
MKTKLILVRHGQSQGNLIRKFLGSTDLDLSELGYRQAELVKDALHGEHIDAVYSSDLKRAYNTGLPTALDHNLRINQSSWLREVFAGEWENRLFSELIEEYPVSYGELWLHNLGLAHPDGGESVEHLRLRVSDELDRIVKANLGKTVLIVTHATPIRALAATWQGLLGSELVKCPWVANASITRAECEDGKYTLLVYGDDRHLGDAVSRLPKTV